MSDNKTTTSGGVLPALLDLVVLAVLVLAAYVVHMTLLPARGEETRRAIVGMEMERVNEWITPRIQGHLYFSRPPMQNWAIAKASHVLGRFDEAAIRWPSVLGIVGASLLVYLAGRTFLGRAAAFASALVFATMVQVLQLGRLGETEALFTLFVAGSLLLWWIGQARGWSMLVTWCGAYTLCALGMLTKGLQAPIYFVGPVVLYLLLTRQWRVLFSVSHVLGVVMFLLVWGAWQVPYTIINGEEASLAVYLKMVGQRFGEKPVFDWGEYVKHIATFPIESLACMLPWSVLFLALFDRRVRSKIADAREPLLFLVVAIGVAFPTVWLPAESNSRYFMPLYPLFALLIGWVLNTSWGTPELRPHWTRFLATMAIIIPLATTALLITLWRPDDVPFPLPDKSYYIAFASVCVLLTALLFMTRNGDTPTKQVLGVVGIAAFLGVGYVVAVMPTLAANSVMDTRSRIEKVHSEIASDRPLVSCGPVRHPFLFYWREPVERNDSLAEIGENDQVKTVYVPREPPYFCFSSRQGLPPEVIGDWELVAEIPCYRSHSLADGGDTVVIGRPVDVVESPRGQDEEASDEVPSDSDPDVDPKPPMELHE